MEDYSLYIYLLFALISLVSGGIKRFRENQKKSTTRPSTFEQDTTVYSPVEEEAPFNIEDIQREHQELKKREEEAQKTLERMAFKKQRSERKNRKPVFSENNEEVNDVDSDLDVEEFDVRKAIIYSEILKRPYQ